MTDFILYKMKRYRKYLVFLSLFIFMAGNLMAQSPNEIVISAAITESNCGNNGTITITAQNTNPTFNPTFAYDVRIGPISVLPSGYTASNFITGLSRGTYSVWVRATYASGNTIEKELPNVVVSGNYVTPTISFISIRPNSLPGAPTGTVQLQVTGGNGPFQVTLNTPQSYENIYASGTFRPGKYEADKNFSIAKGETRIIDWLPPGQYSVSVTDLTCNNTFGGTSVTIGQLGSNFYMGNGYWGMGCDTVLVRMAYNIPNEFSTYYTNLSMIQKYYQYVMISQREMQAAGITSASNIPETLWRNFQPDPHGLPVSAYYPLPNGINYQAILNEGTNDPDKPHLFLRLIPDIVPSGQLISSMRNANTFDTPVFSPGYDLVINTDCKFGARITTQPIRDYLTCLPVTYKLEMLNSATGPVVQLISEGTLTTASTTTFVEIPDEFRSRFFKLTATDGSGQTWVSKVRGSSTTDGGINYLFPLFEMQYAYGTSCSPQSGKIHAQVLHRPGVAGNGNEPFNGFTITLIDGPPEYNPTSDMIGIGESYTIPLIGDPLPGGGTMPSVSGISIFAKNYNRANYPIEIGYRGAFLDIAPGIYTFKITDRCGRGYYVYTPNYAFNTAFPGNATPYGRPRSWYQNDPDPTAIYEPIGSASRPVKHVAVPPARIYQYNEPQITTDADFCGKVRVYPFVNTPNILTLDGVPQTVNAMIINYPQGLNTNSVSSSQGYVYGSYKRLVFNPSTDDPSRIYFDVAKTVAEGSYQIVFTENTYYTTNCYLGIVNLSVSSQSLSYDETTYVGYKCGNTAVVNITATHGQGQAYNYYLYSNSTYTSSTLLASVNDLTAGQPARFNIATNIPGKTIQDFVWIRIVDAKCGDEFRARLSIYDLNVNDFAIVSPNAKLCEGDSLMVQLLRFDPGIEATLTLPNGTLLRNGHQLTDGTTFVNGILQVPHLRNSTHSGNYIIDVQATSCNVNGISDTIFVSVSQKEIWWREDAPNSNWHDPNNWVLQNNVPANAIPAPCTIVHIPQVNDDAFYPNLDGFNMDATNGETGTIRDIYGNPECMTIYFHYGSQINKTHYLRYGNAYVDYNFGKYNNGTLTYQKDPVHVQTYEPILPLERDRWYMLASPLKSIVSGDFGFAGYPKSFQRLFVTQTHNIPSGVYGYSLTIADFSETFNSLGYKLSSNNNAIALNVGGNRANVGFNDHHILDQMDGIVQLPYLYTYRENFYPLHRYSTGNSYFRYYNDETLVPVNKAEDQVTRGEEVSRFIYENETTNQIGGVTVGGNLVQGYAMDIVGEAGEEIMIGNPFMSMIDFHQLKAANNTRIDNYYKVFIDNTWRIYDIDFPADTESPGFGRYIPPLQAIVVRLLPTYTTTPKQLLFPVDGAYNVDVAHKFTSADPPMYGRSASTPPPHSPTQSLYVEAKNDIGTSSAILTWDFSTRNSVAKTIHPDYKAQPQLFFVGKENHLNAIQFENTNRGSVAFGYYSSTFGNVNLKFDNIDTNVFEKIILEDKLTGYRQDVLRNNAYNFVHSTDVIPDRFILHTQRLGIENDDPNTLLDDNMTITFRNNKLWIESPIAISRVELFDTLGKKTWREENINMNYMNQSIISLPKGIYIVKVTLSNHETKASKIFVD